MATTGGGKKGGKKKKGTTLQLNQFLSDSPSALIPTPRKNWADEDDDLGSADLAEEYGGPRQPEIDLRNLPSAPRSSRGVDIDLSRLPKYPPYTAFLGNLPFDVSEDDIYELFQGLNVSNIRFPQEQGRMKGFGYAEFNDIEQLKAALALSNEKIRNRQVRIDIADQGGKDGMNRGGFSDRSLETSSDWRRDDGSGPPMMGGDRRGGPGGGYRDDRRDGNFRPPPGPADTEDCWRRDDGPPARTNGWGHDDRDGGRRDHGPRDDRGGFRDDRGGFRDDRGGFRDDRGGFREDRGDWRGDRGDSKDVRGGFGSDRGGFRDDRGGFRDDRGGNRDERGAWGPRDDRGGFRSDRGGFRDDRRRDDRGGFRDDRGGFRDDRGGFRDDRGGFRDDRGAPRDRDGYGGNRHRDHDGDRYDSRDRGYDGPPREPSSDGPRERPKLNLKPRTAESKEEKSDVTSASSIFGAARPVDTATKERQIEEKLSQMTEAPRHGRGRGDSRERSSREGSPRHGRGRGRGNSRERGSRDGSLDGVPHEKYGSPGRDTYRSPPRDNQDHHDVRRESEDNEPDNWRDESVRHDKTRVMRPGFSNDSHRRGGSDDRGRGMGRGHAGRGKSPKDKKYKDGPIVPPKYEEPKKPDFIQTSKFAALGIEDDDIDTPSGLEAPSEET